MDADIHSSLGACHCGAVRFHVRLRDGLRTARRCTCSLCAKRGAVAVSVPLSGFTLLSGADKLATYRFNTGAAAHHFCLICGIYTHHRRRSNPNEYGVNAACLDGLGPFDFEAVPVIDGIRHPSDGHPARIVGTLRFQRAID